MSPDGIPRRERPARLTPYGATPTTRSGQDNPPSASWRTRGHEATLRLVEGDVEGDIEGELMHCCGSPYQEITVQAGVGALALLRCSHCDAQRWSCDGELLERDAAFARLASAYREVPLQARAARDRAAAANAARHASRVAQRARAQACPTDVQAGSVVDTARLIELLDGWQVLGATA